MANTEVPAGADAAGTREWRTTAAVLAGLSLVFLLGCAAVWAASALEPGDGCGPYGPGGYGCPPPPTTASITVAPDTALVDRQQVTVTGTGFDPFTSFGAAQCDPARIAQGLATEACDLATARLGTTDGNGAAVLTFTVRRIIVVQGQEVDCALSPCVIGAATLTGGTTPIESASAPISFDPTVPPVPRLTVQVTVDSATADAVTGSVTCNRTAQFFVDAVLIQDRGGDSSYSFGYADGLACGPEPVAYTAELFGGTTRLRGGPATYEVTAYAYDGFESATGEATGTTLLDGGASRRIEPAASPGEFTTVEVVGSSGSGNDLRIDLHITCGRAGWAFADVEVSQWAGLQRVTAYGSLAIDSCAGEVDVSVPITHVDGALAGGPAEVRASVYVEDFLGPDPFYDQAGTVDAVWLRGLARPSVGVAPNPGSRITITSATGSAVNGTVACEEPADVELYTVVRQQQGRRIDESYGFAYLPCDGVTSFSIPLEVLVGQGTADVTVYAYAYREIPPDLYEYLWDDYQAASIRLRG